MRILATFLLLCSLTTVIGGQAGQLENPGVKVVAHRGAMTDRPENTMAAFERALELGADIVELDVRTSSDGRLFILHDPRVDRTTNGTGRASDLTWEELRQLDAGSWFDPRFAGEKIPSVAEALRWGRDRTVLLLDLKETGRDFAKAVAAEVRQHGDPKNVVIGVRTPQQAREFRELIPESRQLGFLRRPELIEEFVAAGVDILRLWIDREGWLLTNPELADRVRQSGKKLMINGTTGHPEEAQQIMSFHPDWILIDDVEQLKRSLAKLGMRK
jgi:glycerophosphoryl diester phosphodiesterase